MSRVRADIDTFYGEFPAEFDFEISNEGDITGTYAFIGYHGDFKGSMTGEDTFAVSGEIDSYIGKIDFSITGKYDGKIITGEGVTEKKGRFSVRGIPVGEL